MPSKTRLWRTLSRAQAGEQEGSRLNSGLDEPSSGRYKNATPGRTQVCVMWFWVCGFTVASLDAGEQARWGPRCVGTEWSEMWAGRDAVREDIAVRVRE